jgi:hypothetical protein
MIADDDQTPVPPVVSAATDDWDDLDDRPLDPVDPAAVAAVDEPQADAVESSAWDEPHGEVDESPGSDDPQGESSALRAGIAESVVTPPAGPVVAVTGHSQVDSALAALDGVADAPPAQQVPALAGAQQALRSALDEIDNS